METIDQEIDILGAASNGTINIVPNRHIGDFSKYSFIDQIDMITHRDTTAADPASPATSVMPSQSEVVRAKTNRLIGPIDMTIDFWKKIGSDVGEMFFLMGNEIGRQMAQDYVNTALRCAVANAIDNFANVGIDISAETGAGDALIGYDHLNDINAKFGDRSNSIVAYVMHSKVWHDLVAESIANQSSLDTVAGVTINNGTVASLGRPVIVTDALPLVVATTDYITLGLTRGALTVMESEERTMVNQVVTGLPNLVQRIQGEYAFTTDVKGYTWNAAVRNPDDTALDLAANWSQSASSLKDTALVALRTL
jgi:hypothetical protein